MAAAVEPLFRIAPTTQGYDWGKLGNSSKVAQYASGAGIPDFTLKESAPYAELWMGTHPKSPSRVAESGEILAAYLAAHPELIGDRVSKQFGIKDGNLPFLFKVLAIRKALSIQTHPDKKTAEQLHAEQPNVYTDPNHKPEMAIALTPFQALCGFLPVEQIAAYLVSTPEFASLIPNAIVNQFLASSSTLDSKGPLRDLFSAFMSADVNQVKEEIIKLVTRYQAGEEKETEKGVKELVLILNEQYPGDIGIFCAFLLNYVTLSPGEAMFLGAGEPHAYVSGDIMECMANSDNVIRAGLTPKPKDIPNLVSGLTYNASPPTKHMVQPAKYGGATLLYDPPIPEFSVLRLNLQDGKEETHAAIDGPSVAIVTEGEGTVSWEGGKSLQLSTGNVFFLAAGVEVSFASKGTLNLYRAFVDVKN
ncbi:hypothetical protein SERLA73DRAFT_176798 [Serpula lacrymans var. lacrymans S7.3]|uniref:Mannose-6-phosphate isomerase n=2 Tax=Serpula lacrymans var. lacrymans TaxID=341189 RepID=F8PQ27_SERL3|nr:uncharacterized protein SERLADRAFT_460072 [Serpula lacrymans var. lacrymans S7.9]EGO01492.1 hypothetical protein SERLA73DRAFT_176798 [Serpula lacrymans var. lacrymans S7.3]EGO27152.1 hypothetical protein SERLADRAFT_460072 [Serpula lacrymans var. lacrymans S7.9]